jgi:hypothetical protein
MTDTSLVELCPRVRPELPAWASSVDRCSTSSP